MYIYIYKVIFAFFGDLGDIGLGSVGITGFERGTIGDIQGTRLGATVKMALFSLINGFFENQALSFLEIGRCPFWKLGVTCFGNWALSFLEIGRCPFWKLGVTCFGNWAVLGSYGFHNYI